MEMGKLTYLEEKIIEEIMRVTEIILKLENVDQMLIVPRDVFYGKRMLNHNAEEFLIDESERHPYRTAIYLKVYLPADALNRSHEIEAAVDSAFYLQKK